MQITTCCYFFLQSLASGNTMLCWFLSFYSITKCVGGGGEGAHGFGALKAICPLFMELFFLLVPLSVIYVYLTIILRNRAEYHLILSR